MEGPTKKDYEALAAFRRAVRHYLRFAEEASRKAGITPQQHQALLAVMGQTDRAWASIREIRESLQLAHHAAVGLIDRCQAAGLVERTAHDADRRIVRVSLTDLGREKLAQITRRNLHELRGLDSLNEALSELRNRSH